MATALRPIVVRDDPDWIDVQLWVTRQEMLEDKNCVMIGVGGTHEGRTVGFWLLYPLQWAHDPAGSGERADFTISARLYFLAAEPHSDAFLQCLAKLWKIDPPARMAKETAFGAHNYEGHPEHVLTERVNLFAVVGESPPPGAPPNPDDPYGQFHLVVDLPQQMVKLCEREPDYAPYRQAIIHAMSKEPATRDDDKT